MESIPLMKTHHTRASNISIQFLKLIILFGLLFLSLWAPRPVAAQDDEVDFSAEVDRKIVTTSDMITLQLFLRGTYRNYGHPDLSRLEEFNILSSGQSNSISFVNGSLTSEVIYTYILQPVRAGLLNPLDIDHHQRRQLQHRTHPG